MTVTGTATRTPPRSRRPWLIGTGLLVLIAVLTVLGGRSPGRGGALDPENPGPAGAQAVARVLERQGVAVDIARGQQQLRRAGLTSGTTLLVTGSEALGDSTFDVLRERANDAGALVVVGNPVLLSEEYDDARPEQESTSGRLAAQCDDPTFRDLTVDTGEGGDTVPFRGDGCFRTGSGALLVRPPGEPDTLLYTAGATLTNDQVDEADNAAVVLRLLGAHPRLVWYLPDVQDTVATDGRSLLLFLPPWLLPSGWLALVALLAYLLVRGRRLGPLVTEPLPVTVRARETTESRGRLYARARDREHSAAVLRDASRRRIGATLSLPRDASADQVAAAAAQRVGRPVDDVRRLLVAGAPLTDSTLARLGRDLLTLEDEVRRP